MSTPTITAESAETEREQPVAELKSLAVRDFSMAIALVAIWVYFASQTHFFLSSRNLSNLAVELSLTAVLALGQLLIIVCGQIDLSVGSGVGLFGGMAAVLVSQFGWSAGPAMGVSLILAVLVWLLMGSLIVREKIPAFIITLAGMLVFRGAQWKIINSSTIPTGHDNLLSVLTTWYLDWKWGTALAALVIIAIIVGAVRDRKRRLAFGFAVEPASVAFNKVLILSQLVVIFTLVCNEYQGIPLPALILAGVALFVGVLTRQTRFGRYLYAIGSNEEAAVISGLPVHRVVIGAFGIMGLLVALDGFLQAAYTGAATTTTGEYLELDAIAACVIGGTSLKGGRGTVLGVIFGSLIMASLLNGMSLLSVDPWKKYVARGAVLALAVWLDVRLARKQL